MQGVIQTLTERGFGFIRVDGQIDIYFHAKELISMAYDEIKVGDVVYFDLQTVSRSHARRNIRNSGFLRRVEELTIIPPDPFEAIELQRKMDAAFLMHLSKNPLGLYQLHPKEFEEVIAEMYSIEGYTTELLGSWNQADGGIDILAVKRDIGGFPTRTAIQCKRYARNRRVSVAPIRSLAGVLDRFRAHAGVIVTSSDFTRPAREEADAFFWKINLMNYQGLVEALERVALLVRRPATFSTNSTIPTIPLEIEEEDMSRAAIDIHRA